MYDAHKLPKEIVFLGKMSEFIKGRNMNLVRAINKSYGSIVNRVNVMAKYAVKGLADIDNNKSYYKVLSVYFDFNFRKSFGSNL
jgi:aarF domain-containing kinase